MGDYAPAGGRPTILPWDKEDGMLGVMAGLVLALAQPGLFEADGYRAAS